MWRGILKRESQSWVVLDVGCSMVCIVFSAMAAQGKFPMSNAAAIIFTALVFKIICIYAERWEMRDER